MGLPKVLFGYAVTKNASILSRLTRSIAHQQLLGWPEDHALHSDRVLFVDSDAEALSEEIRGFFHRIVKCRSPFIRTDLSDSPQFSLAILRNETIKYAEFNQYDWIVFCDSDTVVMPCNYFLPNSGFGTPRVYYQQAENEDIFESAKLVSGDDARVFAEANSWFIARRDIFEKIKFNESFYGYGFEDRDFDDRVRAAGFSYSASNLIVVHTFHSNNDRNINWDLHKRNSKLFDACKLLLSLGYKPAELPQTELLTSNIVGQERFFIEVKEEKRILNLEDGSEWEWVSNSKIGSMNKHHRESIEVKNFK